MLSIAVLLLSVLLCRNASAFPSPARLCIKGPGGSRLRAAAAAVNEHQQMYELMKESSTRPKYPEKEEIKAMIAAGTFI
jgi:hypothetical protein